MPWSYLWPMGGCLLGGRGGCCSGRHSWCDYGASCHCCQRGAQWKGRGHSETGEEGAVAMLLAGGGAVEGVVTGELWPYYGCYKVVWSCN